MPKPLRVLTAKEIEQLVLAYTPGMESNQLKTIVAIVLALAKTRSIMIVQADPEDYRLHLRYLSRVDWIP